MTSWSAVLASRRHCLGRAPLNPCFWKGFWIVSCSAVLGSERRCFWRAPWNQKVKNSYCLDCFDPCSIGSVSFGFAWVCLGFASVSIEMIQVSIGRQTPRWQRKRASRQQGPQTLQNDGGKKPYPHDRGPAPFHRFTEAPICFLNKWYIHLDRFLNVSYNNLPSLPSLTDKARKSREQWQNWVV